MFEYQYWQVVYVELRNQCERMTSLLSDQDVVRAYTQNHLTVYNHNAQAVYKFHDLSEEEKDKAIEDTAIDNGRSLAAYKDQLCVLIYSYVEATIKDYFGAFFEKHPEKMSGYVKDHYAAAIKGTGALDVFKKIVASNSRDGFIRTMARVAADRAASSGNEPKKLMQRVADVAGADTNDETYQFLTDALDRLKKHRNELVHEPRLNFDSEVTTRQEGDVEVLVGVRPAVPKNKIPPEDALETYHKLIIYLCNLCLANDVPVLGAEPEVCRYLYRTPEEQREQMAKQFGLDPDQV